jgi:hypothetical protein
MQNLADHRDRWGEEHTMPLDLRRVLSIFLLPLALLASSVSCGNRAHATPPRFPFAYVEDACGPADGLALEFFFTQKQAECGKFEEPYILIEIDDNLPKSAPKDYSITLGRSDVLASRCMSRGQCESATSGTLHLGKFSHREGASGAYELHFNDGSVEKASFEARWCVTRLLCG